MLDGRALPGLRTRLARQGNGPEAPDLFAGYGIPRGDEAPRALFASGSYRYDQVMGDQRGGGGVVDLEPVRHFGFPDQIAGEAIERNQVGVIGDHEQTVAQPCDAAIESAGRVADQAFGARPLKMPDLPAGPGVDRPAF